MSKTVEDSGFDTRQQYLGQLIDQVDNRFYVTINITYAKIAIIGVYFSYFFRTLVFQIAGLFYVFSFLFVHMSTNIIKFIRPLIKLDRQHLFEYRVDTKLQRSQRIVRLKYIGCAKTQKSPTVVQLQLVIYPTDEKIKTRYLNVSNKKKII